MTIDVNRYQRRRWAAKLHLIAEFVGVDLDETSDDSLAESLGAMAERVEASVLRDETTLAESLASLFDRFDAAMPDENPVAALEGRAVSELLEVKRALRDLEARPDQRDVVIEEIGDLMFALGRLAVTLGAASPLEPLAIAVRKTTARLRHYEHLAESESAANFTVADMWAMAKQMARGGG